MSNMVTDHSRNIVAFHPGYYIAEIIDDLNISNTEHAKRVGISEADLCKLMDGQINVTEELAEKISKVFGGSTGFWMNLQHRFDTQVERINHIDNISKCVGAILEELL